MSKANPAVLSQMKAYYKQIAKDIAREQFNILLRDDEAEFLYSKLMEAIERRKHSRKPLSE